MGNTNKKTKHGVEKQEVRKESYNTQPMYTGSPQHGTTTTGSSGGTLHKIGDKLKNALGGNTHNTTGTGFTQQQAYPQQGAFTSTTTLPTQKAVRTDVIQERQDVHVTHEAPTYTRGDATRKEIIQKPIVTEIHEQPIIEVHEQDIHKRVHEKPIVT